MAWDWLVHPLHFHSPFESSHEVTPGHVIAGRSPELIDRGYAPVRLPPVIMPVNSLADHYTGPPISAMPPVFAGGPGVAGGPPPGVQQDFSGASWIYPQQMPGAVSSGPITPGAVSVAPGAAGPMKIT